MAKEFQDSIIFGGEGRRIVEETKNPKTLIQRMTNPEIVKTSGKKHSNNTRHNKVLPCNRVIKGDLEKK